MVYRFTDVNRANHFRELLNENKIEFQEDTQEKKQQTYTLFAIHQKNYKKTMKMNYEVEKKHKKPIIPFRFLRWAVVLFGMGILFLSIVSYYKHMEHLKEQTEINK